MRKVSSRVACSFWYSSGSISNLGSTGAGSVGIHLIYQSLSAILHLGKSTICGSLGVVCIQPSPYRSGELCIFSSYTSSPSSVQVSCRICYRLIQTLIQVVPCWMEAPWLPTVLNMLEDIPHHCPIIRNVIRYVSVVLKGLLSLHLTLWLLRDMCYPDKGSLLQSVRQ